MRKIFGSEGIQKSLEDKRNSLWTRCSFESVNLGKVKLSLEEFYKLVERCEAILKGGDGCTCVEK